MRRSGRWSIVVAFVAVSVAGCGEDEPSAEPYASAPAGWIAVTDAPSGVTVALPEAVEPQEFSGPALDGSIMEGRFYMVEDATGGVGFGIYDTSPEAYSLQVGIAGAAEGMGGTLESSDPIEIQGRTGIEGEISLDSGSGLVRLILLDEHVLTLVSVGLGADADQVEADMRLLTESADFG